MAASSSSSSVRCTVRAGTDNTAGYGARMRLTVLGCSGSFPGPDGPASSYLLEAGGFRAVVDMGNGSLSALQRLGHAYDVDAVLLSHLHADHCLDVCGYYVARKYRPEGP